MRPRRFGVLPGSGEHTGQEIDVIRRRPVEESRDGAKFVLDQDDAAEYGAVAHGRRGESGQKLTGALHGGAQFGAAQVDVAGSGLAQEAARPQERLAGSLEDCGIGAHLAVPPVEMASLTSAWLTALASTL